MASVYPRVEHQCAHSIRKIVLNSGTGTDAFLFIVMLQQSSIPSAAMFNGLGTSAHETGFSVNDIYADFARLGMTLHGCRIRILSHPNKHGATITGVFNISGTGYTMGARSLPELIDRVHAKWLEKQAYYRACRHEKTQLRRARKAARTATGG